MKMKGSEQGRCGWTGVAAVFKIGFVSSLVFVFVFCIQENMKRKSESLTAGGKVCSAVGREGGVAAVFEIGLVKALYLYLYFAFVFCNIKEKHDVKGSESACREGLQCGWTGRRSSGCF